MGKKKHEKIAAAASKTVKERHKAEVAEVAAAATGEGVKEAVAKVKKERKEGAMPELPRLPSKGRVKRDRPVHPCACGCETPTKAEWAPGHDARAKGWALRIERGIMKLADVPANEQKGAKLMLERRKAAGDTATPKADMKVLQGGKSNNAEEAPSTAVNE